MTGPPRQRSRIRRRREHVGCPQVNSAAPQRFDARHRFFAQQRVPEHGTPVSSVGHHYPLVDGVVDAVGDLVDITVHHLSEKRDVDVATADDSGIADDLTCRGVERGEASIEYRTDGSRNDFSALRIRQPRILCDEERVTAGAVDELVELALRELDVGYLSYQCRDLVACQRGNIHDTTPCPHHRRTQASDRRPALLVSHRDDHPHRHPLQRGQVDQQVYRHRIRPLRVVDDDGDRSRCSA
ncbi:Uncharacterised protein [Mycobacteroides abscessus subsp. abscessus]|nr:Uncharacterised protein [Mycobacteroides abscessus subsp. abscessus]